MATDVFVTEERDLLIKRSVGNVSEFDATDLSTAIFKLQQQALALGANSVVALSVSKAITDPYFETCRVHAHGIAVII